MNSKIALDLGLCGVFTDPRSGERTPPAVRRGLRPSPHRAGDTAESEHGQCSRPPRSGPPDSFGGTGATTSRRPSRETGVGVGSDRAGGHLRVVPATETCWSVRRARGNSWSTGGAARRPGTLDASGRRVTCRLRAAGDTSLPSALRCAWKRGVGNGVVERSRRIWGHPNWTQRGRFRLAPGPRARATGSA